MNKIAWPNSTRKLHKVTKSETVKCHAHTSVSVSVGVVPLGSGCGSTTALNLSAAVSS